MDDDTMEKVLMAKLSLLGCSYWHSFEKATAINKLS